VFSAGAEAINPDVLAAKDAVDVAQGSVDTAKKALSAANQMPFDPVAITKDPNFDPFAFGSVKMTPQQAAFDTAKSSLETATSDLSTAVKNIPFSERLSAFTDPEGLRAMGKAALQPQNLLTTGVGLGQRALLEQQENMQRIADEQAASDRQYAQSFTNVLTDSLGMPRGSNPNPYANTYASGGLVRMNGGGGTDGDDYGEGDTGVSYTATEESGIAGYGLDDDSRYFVTPAKGSAAERQSFLRGFKKQDPPTDYRHGFEQEFQFFDFIDDRPVERYLDVFGAGPSDYLAGLLAADQETLDELGTPTAEGTSPLATYTDTKGDQFSGVDNFSDMGVDKLDNLTDDDITTILTDDDDDDVVIIDDDDDVTVDDDDDVTVDDDDDDVTVDDGEEGTEEPDEPPPDEPPPHPVTFRQALAALEIDVDGDYTREEGRLVYDLMQKFGDKADAQTVADYFGVSLDFAQDQLDVIQQNRATKALLDDTIEGGIEQVDPGETAADAYTQDEIDAVFNLIRTGQLTIPAAAEYFQMPVDEVTAAYDNLMAQYNAANTVSASPLAGIDADGDYSQSEIDEVYGLYRSGEVSPEDISGHFNIPLGQVNEILADIGSTRDAAAQADATNTAARSGDRASGATSGEVETEGAFETENEAQLALSGIEPDGDYSQSEIDQVYGLYTQGVVSAEDISSYFNIPVDQVNQILASIGQRTGRAEGGRTGKKRFMTSAGMVELANGGIAEAIPQEALVQEEPVEAVEAAPMPAETEVTIAMFDDGMGGIDHEALVSATIEAIKGTVDNADDIIEIFIEEYGVDNFRILRERVLQSIVPNAQTEGRIEGSGGGMDDEVMGMIGENQPVAVSPDEYIVAADVVSGLGDGSSEAGADILDQVQENVRAARTGGRQPAPIDLSRVLPA
jgi:hypothetical protein